MSRQPKQFAESSNSRPSTCWGSVRLFSKQKDESKEEENNQSEDENDEEEKPREQSEEEYNSEMAEHIIDQTHGHAAVEVEVRKWLREIIVGLNLCPFAEKTMRPTQKIAAVDKTIPLLTTSVIKESENEEVLAWLYTELLVRAEHPGTSIVICPNFHPDDFNEFMGMVSLVEQEIIPEEGFEGVLQVVPFHPQFCFEGSDPDSVDNWTNRSPYPIFHILREDDVSQAVDLLDGDASKVWKRNVDLLEAIKNEMGKEFLERIFQHKLEVDEKKKLQELLKRFRVSMAQPPKNDNSTASEGQ